MVSTAFGQVKHKSAHPAAKKTTTTVQKRKPGTAVKKKTTASKNHKTPSKGHSKTASKYRKPVKKNGHAVAAVKPKVTMSIKDSVAFMNADTTEGAINLLLSILGNELGKPYRMGSDGPTSFDCSGLINFAFSYIGISLPRSSADIGRLGELISMKDLHPGDLLFFSGRRQSRRNIGHMGCVYKVDSGKVYMIHSSREGVNIVDVKESDYYKKRLIYAKRLLPGDTAAAKKKPVPAK